MLSKKMADSVGFSFIVEKLECFSYYGKLEIRKVNAAFIDSVSLFDYCKGISLAACFNNMHKLMELKESLVAKLQDLLLRFKNIEGIVIKLEQALLSEVELFELKRFLMGLEKFADFLDSEKIHLDEVKITNMIEPLNILDSSKQRIGAFSIHDENFPALKAARQEKASIEAKIEKFGMDEELLSKRAEIVAEEDKQEQAALKELSRKLRPFVQDFLINMEHIGTFDFTLAKAELAKQSGAVLPTISAECLFLKNMWNPKTQSKLEKKGRGYSKTSIELEPGATVLIGANMGGKSLTLKTVTLSVLLANMGFCVFASEAKIPMFDDVFFIEESIADDFLSSFGTEVTLINEAVKNLGSKKLFVAIDEPARTTNPTEGAKITKGLVSYLSKQKSTSLISTHYGNVQKSAHAVYKTASFSYDGIENTDISNLANFIKYELVKVDQDANIPTEAINLCKILGMNPNLLAEIET